MLKRIIQPAAKRAGLLKVVGWHTFRHSYSCRLRANHTDVKVQQELLRHSNIATTMNVYTQAVSATGVCEELSVTVRGSSFEDAKTKMEEALQAREHPQ